MTQEWEELKCYVSNYLADTYGISDQKALRATLEKMVEIERRTLPERVADLICQLPDIPFFFGADYLRELISNERIIISNALRTGDTSELEKWQKEKK